MLGSVTRKKVCQPLAPSVSAASSSSVPCACISGISSRATKGKVTKMVASTMPGTAKMIWMSWAISHGPEQALHAEEQHEDQARDDRRNGERQVDQRDQQALAHEIELGDRPGRGDAEHEIQRHGDAGRQQGQPDGRQRVGIVKRWQIEANALLEAPWRTPRPAAETERSPGTPLRCRSASSARARVRTWHAQLAPLCAACGVAVTDRLVSSHVALLASLWP